MKKTKINKKTKMTKKFKKINKTRKTKKKELFSDNYPEFTVKNTGFKNKKTAENTIKLMKNRDITYQFQVINTMYNRALVVITRTNDKMKIKNIKEAVTIFKDWIDDYHKNNRKEEMWNYLKLDVINKMELLAEHYNISKKARGLEKSNKSDKGFLEIYREVNGNIKALRNYPIKKTKPQGQTWDKHRNDYCKRRYSMIKHHKNKLYNENGLPTKLHTNMIMWGCSPDVKNITKLSKKIKKILKK